MSIDRTITGYGRFEHDNSLTNCMMSFVEVEVDTETGKVTLLRVVNATDAGRIVDPQGLEGQLNGLPRICRYRHRHLRGDDPRQKERSYAHFKHDRLQVADLCRAAGH